jgi:beta-glucosidase
MDCGEGVDCADLSLCGAQNKLAKAVFACKKPVITVLIQGRPYAVGEISEKTDALLCAFYPGPMGGQALAELIFGRTVPAGRLPVSVPRSSAQLPVYYNYKMSYDSMRYHNERNTPLFPFGFGLNYTEIVYKNIKLIRNVISLQKLQNGQNIQLEFTTANTGERDGYAVPMLYIHDVEASTVRRVKELKAFDKAYLKPQEEKVIMLSLSAEELSIWDNEMRFTVEKGKFELILCDGGWNIWQGSFAVV